MGRQFAGKSILGKKRIDRRREGKWHKTGSAAWVTAGDQGQVLVQRRGLVPSEAEGASVVEEFPVGQRQLTFMRGELAGGVTPEEAPGLPSFAPGAVLVPWGPTPNWRRWCHPHVLYTSPEPLAPCPAL